MGLTHEQRQAARSPSSVAVTAGAGAGKTHMLTERYLFHLEEHRLSPLEVVAVTFTDKAAAELRARIREKVTERMAGREDVVSELEAAQISTIHSLAARICRDHYDLADISPDFRILDEAEGVVWTAERFAESLDVVPLEIYRKLSFSLVRDCLEAFLRDPVTAERALAVDPACWESAVAAARDAAINSLKRDPRWLAALDVLRAYSGAEGDLIEAQRRVAYAATRAIEGGAPEREHLDALLGIKLTGGSAKKWPDGGLPEVKECLKGVRELAKEWYEAATLELAEADRRLAEMLPHLREAFAVVRAHLADAKRRARVLDYADLEDHALRILHHESARAFYAERWKAFLVDEFQDTNPVQGELLGLLTEGAHVTIVGDEKQSIYGFRRADVSVFRSYREGIKRAGGMDGELSVSFRAHAGLISAINRLFAPVLGHIHQNLSAHREEPPHEGPYMHARAVSAEKGVGKPSRQRAEAKHLADEIRALLDRGLLVHDKKSDVLRPARPGDFAVLSRTWAPLEIYGEALAAADIRAVHAGGGSLLETREVKDAVAMVRFLADPLDDLALVTVLRSPFFAVSDRNLVLFSRELGRGGHWWPRLEEAAADGPLACAADTLRSLLKARRTESPRRLLQLADGLTGYCAVIANLPNASRREADWRGFLETLAKWETAGADDVFTLARHLKILVEAEVELPRPPLDSGDAVSLMTIHAAKGLEWPVVIVPDLSRQTPGGGREVLFDPELGVAFGVAGEDGEPGCPAVYSVMAAARKEREEAEARRVLYVAVTRARDRALLTSTSETGGALKHLLPGLEVAGMALEPIIYREEDAAPPLLPEPPAYDLPATFLLDEFSLPLTDIPVTALGDYAACPQRFRFRFVDGHPGAGEGLAVGRRVGKLTHKALELGIREAAALRRYDETLPVEHVEEAIRLAESFADAEVYSPYREDGAGSEESVLLTVGGVTLHGVIDLVGADFVMDFKSDQEVSPAHHRFQLWAYARAAGKGTAHIAYLRHGHVHTFTAGELEDVEREAQTLFERLRASDLRPTPSPESCCRCPFGELCADRHVDLSEGL